jgi:4-amino-4-deoxy-L-arabinose transferase-like glycosyltransferase
MPAIASNTPGQRTTARSGSGHLRYTALSCFAVIISGTLFAGWALCGPLSQPLELGGDEGFELVKAFLCHRGFHLYSEIWSDQPPLFTQALAALFATTGPSVLWARLLTLLFSAGLLCGVFDLVRQKSGLVAASSAVLLLTSAPLYLTLSVSVMQEVPAFSLGVLSVAAASRWAEGRKLSWLVGSGVLFAAALMIKFTAALFVPAMLVMAGLMGPSGAKRTTAMWAGTTGAALLLLGFALGLRSLSTLVVPHLEPRIIPGVSRPSDFVFPATLFVEHWDVYLTTIVAVCLVASKKLWREAAVPMALLATASLVHWLHRPWWSPYYLHHAIPLSWLAGIGIRELAGEVREGLRSRKNLRLRTAAAAALLAILAVQSVTRFIGEVGVIRSVRTITSDRMLARVVSFRSRTRWIYTQPAIYAFHAGIAVPPELAVLSLKRFWSGQMTWKRLLDTVQKYHPEQLLLLKTTMGPEWAHFLNADYRVELDDGERILYVAKALKLLSPNVVPASETAAQQ